MTVKDFMNEESFRMINEGIRMDTEITKPFCCDLLSIAMSKAPAGCVWVTVMGNVNTLAVASLTETACVILAEGAVLDDTAKEKAKTEGIPVFQTELPIFEAALKALKMMETKG